jgi:hypothetical protein
LVVIGFTASLTGDLNVEAVRQLHGFNLWLDQVTAAGGLKLPDGTPVQFAAKVRKSASGNFIPGWSKPIRPDSCSALTAAVWRTPPRSSPSSTAAS